MDTENPTQPTKSKKYRGRGSVQRRQEAYRLKMNIERLSDIQLALKLNTFEWPSYQPKFIKGRITPFDKNFAAEKNNFLLWLADMAEEAYAVDPDININSTIPFRSDVSDPAAKPVTDEDHHSSKQMNSDWSDDVLKETRNRVQDTELLASSFYSSQVLALQRSQAEAANASGSNQSRVILTARRSKQKCEKVEESSVIHFEQQTAIQTTGEERTSPTISQSASATAVIVSDSDSCNPDNVTPKRVISQKVLRDLNSRCYHTEYFQDHQKKVSDQNLDIDKMKRRCSRAFSMAISTGSLKDIFSFIMTAKSCGINTIEPKCVHQTRMSDFIYLAKYKILRDIFCIVGDNIRLPREQCCSGNYRVAHVTERARKARGRQRESGVT